MRDNRIDILRCVGLLMIILAHVDPPDWLLQLRNFDVPLMVLVSGMSFGLSYRKTEGYREYLWKRVNRLVFPVWIFLSGYFAVCFVLFPENNALNYRTILRSYFLIDGIGYVWVIRVFLLVAIVSPLIYAYHQKKKSDNEYLFVLAALLALYELVRYWSKPYIGSGLGYLASLITHYIFPYAIIFALGLRLPLLTKRKVLTISIVNLGLLVFIAIGLQIAYGQIVPTQKFKYPPSIYYFAYAIFISCLLWTYSSFIEEKVNAFKVLPVVLFIGQNSIWIYLWHILFLKLSPANYLMKYAVVLFASVAITFAQVWIVENIIVQRLSNVAARKNFRTLFTG